MVKYRPFIGISVGDPAGIGPEITAKALSLAEIYDLCRPLVVGEAEMMKDAIRFSGLDLKARPVSSPKEGIYQLGTIDILDLKNIDAKSIQYKNVSADYGRASFEYVKKVIDLALAKEIDATVTGPINKEAINLAGFHYSGHTEIYADFTHTKDYAMMLLHGHFRVIHVSTHVSLREACNRVRKDRILSGHSIGLRDRQTAGSRKSEDRGCGPQSPCRRERTVWPGRDRRDRARRQSRPKGKAFIVEGPDSAGYGLLKDAGRAI